MSEILYTLNPNLKYMILKEREFDTLGLVDAEGNQRFATFIDDEKQISKIKNNVSMIFTTEALKQQLSNGEFGLIIVENPRILFFCVHNYLENDLHYNPKSQSTKIDSSANISSLAYIAQNDVHIGTGVIIEQFVSIYPHVTIEDYSIIRAGATIGGVGFEFKRNDDSIMSVRHLGNVKIGKNVEIQNNASVDRAVFPWDSTYIGENTKLDNFVHIGHAAKIEKNVLIAAHACIGGRTVIMPNTWIGIGAIVRNGIRIGCGARINMGAVVTKPVSDGQSVTGNFAIDHQKFMSNLKNIL